MENRYPCDKHGQKIQDIERRLEVAGLDSIPKILERLSTIMEIESARNEKRDNLNEKQNETLNNINSNLTSLNYKIDNTNKEIERTNQKVYYLEKKLDQGEEKNKIDQRDIINKSYKEKISESVKTVGIPVAIIIAIIELIKVLVS